MTIELFPGVDIAEVRCNIIAERIVRAMRTGNPYRMEWLLHDTRFFPNLWDKHQSTVSDARVRDLLYWAIDITPTYFLQKDGVRTSVVDWLKVLYPADQERVIQLLRTWYEYRGC